MVPSFHDSLPPPIRSVFHPTDFSDKSARAFVHALKIALVRRSALEILHVGSGGPSWDKFPAVRTTLERWKLLPRGSARGDVMRQLGIDVSKVARKRRDVRKAIVEYMRQRDLLVVGTDGRSGPWRWLKPSVAEHIAREAKIMTLFVPAEGRGFVSRDDGKISLRRIVVPVAHEPWPQPAIDAVARVFHTLEIAPEQLVLVHVGDDEPPGVMLPMEDEWPWEWRQLEGAIPPAIASTAEEIDADLIVLATRANRGIRERLRRGITEQLLERTRCPVLSVPAYL